MLFYVCKGRVQVDVSGIQFSAGKGCVFQVPRGIYPTPCPYKLFSLERKISNYILNVGNYYSFANAYDKVAQLFFTQGCVPTENENSTSGSASKPAATEDKSATDSKPNAVGKGRPKGKQKAGNASKA